MPSIVPVPTPVPQLISRPEVSVVVAQETKAPVRRKVSRFEVITSPNVVATVVSETGTQPSGEPSQLPTITHPLSSDPLAVTRITVEPDDKVEVSNTLNEQISTRYKCLFLKYNFLNLENVRSVKRNLNDASNLF